MGLIFVKYCEFYAMEEDLKIVIFLFCAIGKSCVADRQICDVGGDTNTSNKVQQTQELAMDHTDCRNHKYCSSNSNCCSDRNVTTVMHI